MQIDPFWKKDADNRITFFVTRPNERRKLFKSISEGIEIFLHYKVDKETI